jgi:NAD(P)-dependent dehydrogenase (short-subunit alcohol dehydrogenase family)
VKLEGKAAIVTGASSGIGAATVRKLRDAGAKVVGGARRVERSRPISRSRWTSGTRSRVPPSSAAPSPS